MKYSFPLIITLLIFSCSEFEIISTAPNIRNNMDTLETANNKFNHSKYVILKDSIKSNKKSAPLVKSETILFQKTKKKTHKKVLKYGLDSIYNRLASPDQVFKINTSKPNFLKGKKGTIIYIPAKAFGDFSNIDIKLKESYSKESYLFNCLSTQTSNNLLLETKGMVKIEAFLKGRKLKLIDGKKLTFHFPKKNENNQGYRLFNQKINKDSIVEWEEDLDGLKDFYLRELTFCINGSLFIYGTQKKEFNYLSPEEKKYLQKKIKENATMRWEFRLLHENTKDSILSFKDGNTGDKKFVEIVSKIINKNISTFDDKIFVQNVNNKVYVKFTNRGLPILDSNYTANFISKYGEGSKEKAENFELRYYVLKTAKLGWINCDKFINMELKKSDINILSTSKNEDFLIYLNDFNSSIRAKKYKNRFVIKNIPIGLKATLIAIKYSQGKVFIGHKKIETSSKPIKNIKYCNISLEELPKRIKQLASNKI